MRAWMGDEAEPFLASLDEPPQPGLRVNTLKATAEEFRQRSPFALRPVPWCAEGFLLPPTDETRPGRHPYHAAGLYYLQDPSAMLAAVLLDPQPGDRVLDLCAAPGGKATHLAARLGNQGLLAANEVVRGRTAALLDNLERFGAANILITSESPETLAATWPAAFDRVLVDAPCSGEGMFRKTPVARQEWRPQTVSGCALRQTGILEAAARLVRPGGRLVYATCTFAPEENEAVIARFLVTHPHFELAPPPPLPGLDCGRPDWIAPELAAGLPLERCVRIWPHRAPGEGHFFAVLQRWGDDPAPSWSPANSPLPARVASLVRAWWGETLSRPLPETGWAQYGDAITSCPLTPTIGRHCVLCAPGCGSPD